MVSYYLNANDEQDPHKLPDLEVFWREEGEDVDDDGNYNQAGWYFWFCTPGCMPDGAATGPYGSAEEALFEARHENGHCEHGIPEDEECEPCQAREDEELFLLRFNSPFTDSFFTTTHKVVDAARWAGLEAAKAAKAKLGLTDEHWSVVSQGEAKRRVEARNAPLGEQPAKPVEITVVVEE